MAKFKAHNNICLLHLRVEKASADEDATQIFINRFNKLIQEHNVDLENVYNMNESGLVWKALPTKILAEGKEKTVSEHKGHKDRITIRRCANVLGTNKLKPLVIYKYKNPRA